MEPSNKFKAMLYSNFTTKAVQYGIESEEKAVKLYLREMQKQGFNLKVDGVGLLVSRKKTHLGASLDRIVTNMDQNSKWGMETKSPFSKAGMDVDKVCKSKTFCLEKIHDGTIRSKRNHDYSPDLSMDNDLQDTRTCTETSSHRFVPSSTATSAFIRHILASRSDQPNAFGYKIPVATALKVHMWAQLLRHYDDKIVVEFLKFFNVRGNYT